MPGQAVIVIWARISFAILIISPSLFTLILLKKRSLILMLFRVSVSAAVPSGVNGNFSNNWELTWIGLLPFHVRLLAQTRTCRQWGSSHRHFISGIIACGKDQISKTLRA